MTPIRPLFDPYLTPIRPLFDPYSTPIRPRKRWRATFVKWHSHTAHLAHLWAAADEHRHAKLQKRYLRYLWKHRLRCRRKRRHVLRFALRQLCMGLDCGRARRQLVQVGDAFRAHSIARRALRRWQRLAAGRGSARDNCAFASDHHDRRRKRLGFVGLKVRLLCMGGPAWITHTSRN